MSPSETPGDFDDLEPILDGDDLEPIHDGGDLEPIEAEAPAQAPEAEPTLDLPEEPEAPEISQPEPMEEPEPTPEPAAVLVEEELPAEEPSDVRLDKAADPAVVAAEAESFAGAPSARGSKHQEKRELEKAPLMLLKASQLLMIAAILPFGGAFEGWWLGIPEKLICGLGIWLAFRVQGDPGKRKSGTTIGLIVACLGLIPITGHEFLGDLGKGLLLEKMTLLFGGFTYIHIVGYQHGGKFNPLYAVLLTEPLFAGIMGMLTLSKSSGFGMIIGYLGAFGVTYCGFQAIRTMVAAFKEAKAEGEAKKKAAIEARRAARKAGKKVEPLATRKHKA